MERLFIGSLIKAMQTSKKIEIVIAKDFSRTPGPRYTKEGDFSGEKFRETLLLPRFKEAQQSGQKLLIDLDETAGYGTSFLEEAFGGLIRVDNISIEEVNKIVEIKSDEERYLKDDIDLYIAEANNEKQA